MPPLPLDERIVVIQRPRNLALCESPQTVPQPSAQISSSSNGQLAHPSHRRPSQSHSPACKSLTLECQRRSSRFLKSISDHSEVPVSGRHTPSHCHSNGTVTLGPRLPPHTHKIDIRLTLDRRGQGDGISNSSVHCKSVKSGRGKCASSQLDQGQWERKTATAGRSGGPEPRCMQVNQLSTSPGGVLQFVPAQTQQQHKFRSDREKENSRICSRGDQEFLSLDHKKKLGSAPQSHNSNTLPYHCYSGTLPHASVLNSKFPTPPQSRPTNAQLPFLQLNKPQSSNSRDHRPRIFHGLPLSPCSSHAGRFPSPDHTCTINCTHPFSCCHWKFLRCRSCKGNSGSCEKGGGSSSTSFSCVQNDGVVKKRGKEMGLGNLGGCLSNGSTSNTSSSNSTVSDCRGSRFKPLLCTSCSGEAKTFESPTVLRKRLVAGCLPCTPSAPLRAIQSCVMGCNPKSSQTGSSTCSYCSSDPIVVTYNPHRKPPGKGIAGAQLMRKFQTDDEDDYSASTVWPGELAKKFSHSKAQKNYRAEIRTEVGRTCGRQAQGDSNRTGLVALDCQNLQDYAQAQHTDHAGRQWLQQGRMAAFDFLGSRSRSRYDGGQNSLKRLLNMEDIGMDNGSEQHTDVPFSQSFSPLSASPPSPVSFSPSPSAPSTLTKPKPWLRDKEGGHSLPSAQSLHLALNSLNREQDEERSRSKTRMNRYLL